MTTAINTIQESQLVLPFGSVYYTSLGTLSTKESPSSVMTLIKTHNGWYKPSVVERMVEDVAMEDYDLDLWRVCYKQSTRKW